MKSSSNLGKVVLIWIEFYLQIYLKIIRGFAGGMVIVNVFFPLIAKTGVWNAGNWMM
tara:strand:- start:1286 stop:1456 length:171 start_codon:yes stop_codon:yes gene_type:complete